MDNEEAVRGLVRRMLELMGFAVLSAQDGREGVEVLRREGEHIRLVIPDMTRPHLDGAETLREMRRIRGDVKVILSSGYGKQSAIGQVADQGLRVSSRNRTGTLIRSSEFVPCSAIGGESSRS